MLLVLYLFVTFFLKIEILTDDHFPNEFSTVSFEHQPVCAHDGIKTQWRMCIDRVAE